METGSVFAKTIIQIIAQGENSWGIPAEETEKRILSGNPQKVASQCENFAGLAKEWEFERRTSDLRAISVASAHPRSFDHRYLLIKNWPGGELLADPTAGQYIERLPINESGITCRMHGNMFIGTRAVLHVIITHPETKLTFKAPTDKEKALK